MDNSEEEIENEIEDLLLPGQKYPTPPQGNSSRAFYESLLDQKAESIMALRYCIDYGCLDAERATRGMQIIEKAKKKIKK